MIKSEYVGSLVEITGCLQINNETVEVRNLPVFCVEGVKSYSDALNIHRDKKLLLEVSKLSRRRSDAQNRYIWGVVVPCTRAWLKETTGEKYTPDFVYSWLRSSILGAKPEVKTVAGEEVIVMTSKRFSKMTTVEFSEAIELILDTLAERGCIIPEPKANNFLSDFYK